MKVIFINVLLLLVIIHIGYSQETEWAPIGAKWYHLNTEQILKLPVVSESIKDTLVKDKVCRKIVSTFYEADGVTIRRKKEFLTYEEKAIVYYYESHCDSFLTLYNFKLQQGDTMKYTKYRVSTDTKDEFTAKVDSIAIRTINSQQEIPFYIITPKITFDGNGQGNGYYHYIGADGYVFVPPVASSIPGFYTQLTCYTNGEEEYRFTSRSCNLLTNIDDIPKRTDNVKLYPTVLTNNRLLKIENLKRLTIDIIITDTNGRILQTYFTQSVTDEISLSRLSSGMYIIYVRGDFFYDIHKVVIP